VRHFGNLFTIPALLALVLLLPAQAAEEKTLTVTVSADGVQRVQMTAGNYFFDPNHLIVKANVKVELTVMKESGMTPHDIEMKSPEAGMEFSENLSSTPKTITFTPSQPGKYPFFCGKKLPLAKGHRERGMEGLIEVVP
jgi:plastocyanin